MDSKRFDGLVRSLGQARSRRQTLRGLAGAVAVGALAVGWREASAAKPVTSARCLAAGKGCKSSTDCCPVLTCQPNTGKGPAKTCKSDPNCPEPSKDSTFSASCTGVTLHPCTADGTLLSATCDGNPTSIIVNTCASTNYAIANIFGTLTCCNC